MNIPIGRRSLLGGAVLAASSAVPLSAGSAAAAPRDKPTDPFQLGVASGDPAPDGFVLWTRLAPDPLAADGLGGMPKRRFPVHWEISETEQFGKVSRRGVTWATPEYGHSVHVEATGLEPDRVYFYRFRVMGEISPVGRTRTAPTHGARKTELRLAVASCQAYTAGYFTAYQHLLDEDIDLVLHLGDYIYDTGASSSPVGGRQHVPAEPCRSLSDYRVRHALYKTDADLQAAHAAFPFAVTWDDGEVTNNYADDRVPDQTPEEFLRQRAAAYQAYYENMPLRRASLPEGPDMRLYRSLTYGNLAKINILDTRQYRDDQPCGARVAPPCAESLDPARTMTGHAQERWLRRNLTNSGARWNLIANQVFFSRRDLARTRDLPASETLYAMDKWDGYVGSRNRILDLVREHNIANPVLLAGDDHVNWACDVKADFDDPDSPTAATEFLTTSLTSGGDRSVPESYQRAVLSENAHIRYANAERGYLRCTLGPEELRIDYRVLPYVTRPDAPIRTDASFVVESGRPGLQPG